jgi:hypothetical protein
MRKKILLPRKDHEVYFINLPEGIKKRRVAAYVEDTLHERHPGFSPASVCDSHRVSIDGRKWIMATVMEHETLAEYRLTHPRALLFTATGVLVRRHGFPRMGMTVLADETVGYDVRDNLPVSLPVRETPEDDKPAADISTLLKKTPSRYSVFRTRRSPVLYALFLLPPAALGAIILARPRLPPPEVPVTLEVPAVIPAPKPDAPDALTTLAELAGAIGAGRGTIDHWQYDETTEPALTIQLTGLEADTMYGMITAFPYAVIHDISDISYAGTIPRYTVRLSRNTGAYRIPDLRGFTTQEESLRLFSLLRERFSVLQVRVVSESPPPPATGTGAGTVTLEVEGRDLAGALEAAGETFNGYGLGIRAMTVSLDKSRGIFTFSCSFMPCRDIPGPSLSAEVNNTIFGDAIFTDAIPAAFGYIEKKVPEKAPEAVTVSPQPEKPSYTTVGTIRDEGQNTIMYYKNPEGKIIIQEEQSP